MNLPELSIRRHVLAYMLNAVLVLFGIIGFRDLGVDRFPNVDIPVVTITTIQPGANPSVVDASITNIIERQVNSVPGIKNIRSSSTPGVSVVAIDFELEKNVDVAFNEVQAKVNQVLNQLPTDADPPIVAKLETTSQPILWLALQGDRTEQQLNVYANNVLRKQLENVNGVGEVRIAGSRERTVRVEVEPARLASYGLTVQDLLQAFQREHFLLPGGFVVGKDTEALLKLDLEYHDPAALGEMVVGYADGAPIRLRMVARVVDGLADFRQLARYNGAPTVGLGIVKIAGSNSVAIINEIKHRLETEINPQLPPGMTVAVATDTSTFILEMVHALQEHLITGTLLAAAVVLLFLRNFRSTVIIAAAIPVSLMGAVAVMYFFGYTFNVVTLLALLLLIGVVVDDAIVVLENIYRHREEIDPDPVSAAMNGTQEVMFAVLAATLSLVSIFVPVVFMGGIVGRFFESFAVVVVFGVLLRASVPPHGVRLSAGVGGVAGRALDGLAAVRARGAVERLFLYPCRRGIRAGGRCRAALRPAQDAAGFEHRVHRQPSACHGGHPGRGADRGGLFHRHRSGSAGAGQSGGGLRDHEAARGARPLAAGAGGAAD